MFFRKSPEKFWNLIASKYATSPITDIAAYEKKIEKLKSYLSPEDVVLDIGCGTGTQCGDLAGNVKQVTGIDISSKLLAIAEQRKAERKLDNIEFIKTSLYDERLKADGFDVVMAFFVLHFLEDIDAVFQRIHDLLKPGVYLFLKPLAWARKVKLQVIWFDLQGILGFCQKSTCLRPGNWSRHWKNLVFNSLIK